MPVSMSARAADAFAERERRLVDHLADDPPEHQPGRVADPGDVLAERAEEALGALGRQRRGALASGSARPGSRLRSGGSTWKPTALPPGSSAPSEPLRAQHQARARRRSAALLGDARRDGVGRLTVAFDDQRRQHAAAVLRAGCAPRSRPRSAARAAPPASTPSPEITTTPSPAPAAALQRRRVLRSR